jgi:hypothetical protein
VGTELDTLTMAPPVRTCALPVGRRLERPGCSCGTAGRWCVRAVGLGGSVAFTPDRRPGRSRLVGHRRAQVAQRPLRLRHRSRPGSKITCPVINGPLSRHNRVARRAVITQSAPEPLFHGHGRIRRRRGRQMPDLFPCRKVYRDRGRSYAAAKGPWLSHGASGVMPGR